jgi:hypothetical protein
LAAGELFGKYSPEELKKPELGETETPQAPDRENFLNGEDREVSDDPPGEGDDAV